MHHKSAARLTSLAALVCLLVSPRALGWSQLGPASALAAGSQPTLQTGIEGCTNDVVLGPQELTCRIWLRIRITSDRSNLYDLSLLLRTRPEAEVSVEDDQAGIWPFRGKRLGPPEHANALGEARITTLVRKDTPSITLIAREHESNAVLGRMRVRLQWVQVPPLEILVLESAIKYTDPKQQTGILQDLEQKLSTATTPEDRLALLMNLVQLRNAYRRAARTTQGGVNAAQVQTLMDEAQQAFALAKKLRRVRTAARLLPILEFLAKDDRDERLKVAEQIEQLLPEAEVIPAEQSDLHENLASSALRDKDLRKARKHFTAALAAANWLGDAKRIARQKINLTRENFSEGVKLDADLQNQEREARQHADVCEGSRLLLNLGWLHLLNWESKAGAARDPIPLFKEVLQRSSGPGAICPNLARTLIVHATLARRLSFPPLSAGPAADAQIEQAKLEIAEVTKLAAGQALEYQVETDLLFAKARVGLRDRNRDLKKSYQQFSELAERTTKNAIIEDRWEATCGAGIIQLQLALGSGAGRSTRIARQQQLLDACSDLLDQHVENIWLTQQAKAVDVYSDALGRLLTTLPARDRDALLPMLLATLRRASRRAIAPYRWPLAASSAPPALDGLNQYRTRRAAFEVQQAQSWSAQLANLETAADKKERITKRHELLDLLDAAFVELRNKTAANAPWQTLPEIPPNELLLVCHPAGQNMFCITSHRGEQHGTLITADQLQRKNELAAELLGPWRAKLPTDADIGKPSSSAPIQRLRVIAHGWLRESDVAAWPFDGKPLIARLPVVYGLDIKPVPSSTSSATVAMAIHPDGPLGGADATLDMLHSRPALRALLPHYFSVDVVNFKSEPVDKEPLFGRLYPEHNRAATFAVIGHFRSNMCSQDQSPIREQSPWLTALCLPGQNSLWPGDVLLAPQVPRTVLLMGCSSAGQPSAGSTSAVTMASAYVLRGSTGVLGTARDIERPLAQQMLCHLTMDASFGTARFDLPKAVQLAQLAIADQKPCPSGVDLKELVHADWSAFRVYVP